MSRLLQMLYWHFQLVPNQKLLQVWRSRLLASRTQNSEVRNHD
jgi:hypothetical protein